MSELVKVLVPKAGMDTTEVQVVKWLVGIGDQVHKGTPLVEVETEKVTFTVDSEVAGELVEISQPEESVVGVGEPICVIKPEVNHG